MKLKHFLLTTLCLSLMMCGLLTSCKSEDSSSEQTSTPETTSPNSEGITDTNEVPEDETSAETEKETECNDTYVEPVITGPYADTIMLSNRLSNGVQA